MSVRITNIQHFSLHDGPGIRTTVFLKGCNLNCPWCCNPENMSYDLEYYYDDGVEKTFGYDISLEDLEKEILKDEIYYSTGGGVTFSGGEALLQIKSLEPLLTSLKENGIDICFETSLSVSEDLTKIAIKYANELFVDIKLLDKNEAKDILNLDIDLFYRNMELLKESKCDVCFRVPLSNEYTFKKDNVDLISNLIKKYSDFSVEIFKVHNLAENKYIKLNKNYSNFSDISDKKLNNLCIHLKKFNSNVKIIKI